MRQFPKIPFFRPYRFMHVEDHFRVARDTGGIRR
jgi:hypothetical protein